MKKFNSYIVILMKGQFIRNGKEVGYPWYLESDEYYPTVAINSRDTVQTNFGEHDFQFKGKDC